MHTNKSLAPRARNVKSIQPGIELSEGFISKQTNPYLTRVVGDQLGLYKLYGGRVTSQGGPVQNVYARIDTLGFKGEDGFRVVEYKFGEPNVKSIFADNKVELSEALNEVINGNLLIGQELQEAMQADKASEINKCK